MTYLQGFCESQGENQPVKTDKGSGILSLCTTAIFMAMNVALSSFGRAFIYATPAAAVAKLPFRILQATVGAVVGMILCWPCGLHKVYTAKILKNR